MFDALLAIANPVGAASPWTWALYERPEAVSFAQEVPDTDRLGAVFECAPKSGRATLTLYEATAPAPSGTARLRAGLFPGSAPFETGESLGKPWVRVSAPAAHPVLRQFWRGGRLTVTLGDTTRTLLVPPERRADLLRFAGLCAAPDQRARKASTSAAKRSD